ncbi:MAG: DUF4129 domain-containing protein [Deinococcus sp.]|uniref:DUF4129 domain-containing protein n=1 Tax=Deinococcus sp. TaxID=47478 RepID=UPI0026DB4A3A|nr:DUF4129 domain-containing protein [Deinococcus sp.]MDO4244750.1 DUF4129 domain-containing protein [Deinococcus sp.]
MTTSPAPPLAGDLPTPLTWRRALLALLPLSLAGVLPLWVGLGLCAVTLLGLRWPEWASARLMIFMLLLGLGMLTQLPGAWQAGPSALMGLALTYLLQLVLVLLLNLGLNLAEDGKRRGVLLALLPGLLAPQVGLLLAAQGGLLGREGADDRYATRRAPLHRPMWQATALGAAAVLGLGLLLPQSHLHAGTLLAPDTQSAAPPPEQASRDVSNAADKPPPPPADAPRSVPLVLTVDQSRLTLPPLDFALLGGLLLVVAAGVLLGRGQQAGRRLTLPELLAALGLGLTGGLVLLSALMSQRQSQGVGGETAPQDSAQNVLENIFKFERAPETRELDGTGLANFSGWLWVGLLALALVLLYAALWKSRTRREARAEAEALLPGENTPAPALHRVRLAYRRAEAALHDAGHARTLAETPAAYAARLGAEFPALADALQTLTRAYQPVRYGGRVTDEDADSAEAAAEQICTRLSQLSVTSAGLKPSDA